MPVSRSGHGEVRTRARNVHFHFFRGEIPHFECACGGHCDDGVLVTVPSLPACANAAVGSRYDDASQEHVPHNDARYDGRAERGCWQRGSSDSSRKTTTPGKTMVRERWQGWFLFLRFSTETIASKTPATLCICTTGCTEWRRGTTAAHCSIWDELKHAGWNEPCTLAVLHNYLEPCNRQAAVIPALVCRPPDCRNARKGTRVGVCALPDYS